MSTDIDRRALMLGLLSTAALWDQGVVDAEEAQASPDPSLYIPKAHVVEERAFLHDFMEEYPFIALVTTSPGLRITHIPSVLDRTRGRFGTLRGHISAQNPQRTAFDGTHQAVAIFPARRGTSLRAGIPRRCP